MTDTRYVYGARCTWHGPISAVGTRGPVGGNFNLPCCPHCSGVLFEYETQAQWDEAVKHYDMEHPGYYDFTVWLAKVGRCWPNHKAAAGFYKLDTGKDYPL